MLHRLCCMSCIFYSEKLSHINNLSQIALFSVILPFSKMVILIMYSNAMIICLSMDLLFNIKLALIVADEQNNWLTEIVNR